MGFSLEYVLSDDSHVAEFICKICLQLVEHPVIIAGSAKCEHAFCRACLEAYIHATGEDAMCPTCKSTRAMDARDIKLASPLSYRVLSRIRVRCMLQGCGWRGEYSELTSHLTNTESHTAASGDATGVAGGNAAAANAAIVDGLR